MPRVSVMMASYNHAPYVRATIESVQAQTFQDFEIVVTDDGSSDGTPDIMNAIGEPRLKLHRFDVNRGAVVAGNNALSRASGEYISILNSDDVYLPQKLERQVAFLDANPEIGAVFALPTFIDHHGEPIPQDQALNGRLFDVENRSQAEWLRHFFFFGNCLCHPTAMVRRACYDRLGAYDARFAALPDFHMWIRLVAAMPIHILPERLTAFRQLPNAGNASSLRLDNYLRFTWENPRVLALYASMPASLIAAIFAPEIAALKVDPTGDPRNTIGRICIATNNPTLHRLGFDLLFDLLSADGSTGPHEFTHADFHRHCIGAKDVFNVQALNRVQALELELRQIKEARPTPVVTATPSFRPALYSGVGSLAILDDYFPLATSAFRFEEYLAYLETWPDAKVYTTGASLALGFETRSIEEIIAEFETNHPEHTGRVLPLSAGVSPSSIYYTIFLNNAFTHIESIEQSQSKFAFALYPGGGFNVDQPDTDQKLARVLSSSALAYVISTQPVTSRYLAAKNFCRADQIVEIFGGVVSSHAMRMPGRKKRFLIDKSTADVCFVANRYMPQGQDKGYDLFISATRYLIEAGMPVRCHVVGPWDASVLPLGPAAGAYTFYGAQPQSFFHEFYAGMDIIVSPNRPFVLAPGAFDGFLTGCCTEACLQEVAVVCTDPLRLNIGLREDTDVCIIQPDLTDIVSKLAKLLSEPERLSAMGPNGRARLIETYGLDTQIKRRIEKLSPFVP